MLNDDLFQASSGNRAHYCLDIAALKKSGALNPVHILWDRYPPSPMDVAEIAVYLKGLIKQATGSGTRIAGYAFDAPDPQRN